MFTIKPYSDRHQDSYCELYIETWKAEPYGELFTQEEIVEHLVTNKGYHYLLVEDETDTFANPEISKIDYPSTSRLYRTFDGTFLSANLSIQWLFLTSPLIVSD